MNIQLEIELKGVLQTFVRTELQDFKDYFKEAKVVVPTPGELTIEGVVNGQRHPLVTVVIQSSRVAIPSIVLPHSMQYTGLGKKLLKVVHHAARQHRSRLQITSLVPSFYQRLVKRGAEVIVENDCVEITDDTDLTTINPPAESPTEEVRTLDIIDYLKSKKGQS